MVRKEVTDEAYDQAVRRIARDAYARNPSRVPARFVVAEIEAFCDGTDVCSLAMWNDVNHAYGTLGGPLPASPRALTGAWKPPVLLVAGAAVGGIVYLARAWSRGSLQTRLSSVLAQGR